MQSPINLNSAFNPYCFVDLRLKFLTLFAIIVVGILSLITARQFGAGVLEDSFASRLSTHYRTSAQFMALYGLLNFYVYAMSYVYAPGIEQIYGQRRYTLNNFKHRASLDSNLCLACSHLL
jgi:hypothetical protein